VTGKAVLLPGAASLAAARDRIRAGVRQTPLERSDWLSERAGCAVYLKLECWQRTHSFKIRGALNAVASLSPDERARGLVTASAGNHGLAVAEAARDHDATATIFVPLDAPTTKKTRIRRAGAELREVDGTYDDAVDAARGFARDTGALPVHAFADPAVVAGQGTLGLEIVERLPGVRDVVVPVGGGGLAAGTGAALTHHAPSARLVGVQSTATRAMHDAFRAGRVVPSPFAPSLCDGLAGETEQAAYEALRAVAHALHLVDEAAVADGIREVYRQEGVVAEGSGVVGVVAVLTGVVELQGPAVIVVSGGNIDGERLARILLEE
jgi:threonine dehydratase